MTVCPDRVAAVRGDLHCDWAGEAEDTETGEELGVRAEGPDREVGHRRGRGGRTSNAGSETASQARLNLAWGHG